MLRNIGIYILFGICTLIIVPTLAVLSVGLFVSAVAALFGGLLRTLGFSIIQMTIWSGVEIPVAFSLPMSILVASILSLLAFKSWTLLRRYLYFININR